MKLKNDYRTKIWKGRDGRLYRLADRILETSEAIRYAEKPHDLVFPITRLTELTNQARDMQWEWLAEKMNIDRRDWNKYPPI